VTTCAGDGDVRPGQRKRSFVVVKRRRLPGHRAVATRASGRDPRLCVGRALCPVEVLYVTAVTICRCPLIFSADVAGEAIQRGVGARQRVSGVLQVIKFRA
jgi:hypothetical protein